jgi:predicted nuclease of predicted toxin-antitoxin system
VRFLVDMPLSPALAVWPTQQGHDAVHACAIGLSQASDAAILRYARSEMRVLVTADLDYPRLLALAQAEVPGLILLRGGDYGEQEAIGRVRRAQIP